MITADLFEVKNISPMLLTERAEPFDDPGFIFELKLDGIRAIAYIDKEFTEIRNKRNLRIRSTYPELQQIHLQINRRCILDGEIIAMRNGEPDFSEVQRRALMSNPLKIELAAKRLPVSFVAYDLLYIDDHSILDLPLTERKKLLHEIVDQSPRLALSQWFDGHGTELYQLIKQRGLEGIVAKRKSSKYWQGKRSKDWIKVKYLKDQDFFIAGYIPGTPLSKLVLASYDDSGWHYRGHVAIGTSREDFRIISKHEKVTDPPFTTKDNAVWIQPGLVCTVAYMDETSNGGLRQPVFKRLRYDSQGRPATTCEFIL